YSAQSVERPKVPVELLSSLGFSVVSSHKAAVYKAWPTNSHRVARRTLSNRGSAWVKTSRSPTIKFKTRLDPKRATLSRQELHSIPVKPRIFWLSTCQRLGTSSRRAEKTILRRTISKDLRLCFHRCCRVLVANLPAASPLKRKGRPFS